MIDARFEKRRIAARTTILSLNPSGFNLSQGSLFLNFKNYGINSLIIIFFTLYLVDSLKIKNCAPLAFLKLQEANFEYKLLHSINKYN